MINCNVGLGTAGLRGETRNVVFKALEMGVKVIDSAQAKEWYSEAGVGQAIASYETAKNISTKDIVIITKIHPRSFELEKMKRALIESKSNFGRDSLDVVLLHFPRCQPGQCNAEEQKVHWKTGWKNLEMLRTEHDITEIGVSNFEMHDLQTLSTFSDSKIAVIQNWMDPFHQDKQIREFAAKHHIQYMAYSSFGTQWGRKYDHNVVFHNPALERIAIKHDSTIAKVVMSWLYLEDVVAIPRSANFKHLEENFLLMGRETTSEDRAECEISPLPLDEEDLALIRSLDGILGNPWDK